MPFKRARGEIFPQRTVSETLTGTAIPVAGLLLGFLLLDLRRLALCRLRCLEWKGVAERFDEFH